MTLLHAGPLTLTLELALWLACQVFGLYHGARLFFDVWADRRFLRDFGVNGAREALAQGHVRREFTRTFTQSLFLLVGILALFTPPRNPPSLRGLVFAGLLIAASAALALNTWFDRQNRVRVLDELERRTSPIDPEHYLSLRPKGRRPR